MRKGTYTYTKTVQMYPTPQYAPQEMRVEVIGETDKSYNVKYLEFHANGRRPGSTAWVQKRKVKIDGETGGRQIDPETIRKPYKE